MCARRYPPIFVIAVSWQLIWTRPAVDVDHPLLAQEVIGAPREPDSRPDQCWEEIGLSSKLRVEVGSMSKFRMFLGLVLFSIAPLAIACAGDQGPPGPAGPQGEQVPASSVGLQGETGPVAVAGPQGMQVQRYDDSVALMMEEALAAKRAVDANLAVPGVKSEVDDAKRWFDAMIDVQEKFVGALGGVGDPPGALKEAHNNYFAAVSELLAGFHRISDRLADAGADLDMAQLANDPELGTARDVADKACGVLEQATRESVVGANLSCSKLRYGLAAH